jgi:hypothetical protein
MKHRKFDLEKQLRAGRSTPRAEFAQGLAEEVRDSRPARSPLGRVGLALALSGLIVIALASFGGISYASSSVSHAAKKQTKQVHVQVANSAAHAQYAPYTPPKPKPEVQGTTQTGGIAGAEAAPPAQVKSAELPFTGLSLWMPLAIGLVLVSIGLVLRTRARRRDTA